MINWYQNLENTTSTIEFDHLLPPLLFQQFKLYLTVVKLEKLGYDLVLIKKLAGMWGTDLRTLVPQKQTNTQTRSCASNPGR